MADISRERAEALVERHLELFGDPDRSRRARSMQDVFTEDVVFTDPHHRGTGYDGYHDAADDLHARMPGFALTPTGAADVHHDLARFGWTLTAPGGPVVSGIDVIRFRDGRIADVAIFIDPPA